MNYLYRSNTTYEKNKVLISISGKSQGVLKGTKPLYKLICNDTKSKNEYALEAGITTVIKMYYHFLFQCKCGLGGLKTIPGSHVLYTMWWITIQKKQEYKWLNDRNLNRCVQGRGL